MVRPLFKFFACAVAGPASVLPLLCSLLLLRDSPSLLPLCGLLSASQPRGPSAPRRPPIAAAAAIAFPCHAPLLSGPTLPTVCHRVACPSLASVTRVALSPLVSVAYVVCPLLLALRCHRRASPRSAFPLRGPPASSRSLLLALAQPRI
jgi:hypothetical protein